MDNRRTPRRRSILQDIPLDSPGNRRGLFSIGNESLVSSPLSPDEAIIQARREERLSLDQSLEWDYGSDDSYYLYSWTRGLHGSGYDSERHDDTSVNQSSDRRRTSLVKTPICKKKMKFDYGREGGMLETLKSGPDAECLHNSYNEQACGLDDFIEDMTASDLSPALPTTLPPTNCSSPVTVGKSEEVCQVIDIDSWINGLDRLCRIIYKSFPVSRSSRKLQSTRDSYSFKRIRPHLQLFKTAALDRLKLLVDSSSWEKVVSYVIKAYRCVYRLPIWINESHNNIRLELFACLASACLKALKQMELAEDSLQALENELSRCQRYDVRIQSSVEYIRHLRSCMENPNPST